MLCILFAKTHSIPVSESMLDFTHPLSKEGKQLLLIPFQVPSSFLALRKNELPAADSKCSCLARK